MNKCYIYTGYFDQENFEKFIEINYKNEDEQVSELYDDLDIDYVDDQYLEVEYFQEPISLSSFEGFSYFEQWIDKLDISDLINSNAIICLFEPFEIPSKNPLRLEFLGEFTYSD